MVFTTISFVLACIFFCLALIFFFMKEKGAMLISGFNTLPPKEQDTYDQLRLSEHMRNILFLWCAVLLVGTLSGYFIHYVFAIIACVIWLVLFVKDVHWDAKKAFAPYKK